MTHRIMQLIAAIGLGTAALLAVMVLLVGPAAAADQCVHPTGAGGCLTTIQSAINNANPGDSVRVVQGTYNENLVITKNLVLEGGYQDQTLATRDPSLYETIINGGGVDVVISITNNADVAVDGFTITGGDGSNNVYLSGGSYLDSGGGGIFVREATAIIRNNVISGNVGSTITSTSGLGGGILVISSTSPVRIYDNLIQANAAQSVTLAASVPISAGVGGGIAIGNASSAIITGNQVLSNVALRANISPQGTWSGAGGIGWWGEELAIDDNEIWYNVGNAIGGDGGGGGLSLWGRVATLTNNSVAHNIGAISGTYAQGGGITAGGVQTLTLTNNWVMTNTAIVTAASSATPQDTWVGGGGINIGGHGTPDDSLSLQDNHIIGNLAVRTMTTSGTDSRGHVEGGGLIASGISTTLILNNEVRGNIAVEKLSLSGNGGWGGRPAGGGMFLADSDSVTLSNNEIRDNLTAKQQVVDEVSSNSEGGGLVLINLTSATVSNNTISGNTAVLTGSITSDTGENYYSNGGGVRIGCWDKPTCSLSFSGNDILSNTTALTITVGGSDANGGANGGGLDADRIASISFSGDTVRGNRALISGLASGNNRVEGAGGGLNFSNSAAVTIGGSGCAIEDNMAAETAYEGYGGGVSSWNSVLTLSDCTVKGNQALANGIRGEGGGLAVDNNDEISDPAVTLIDNWIEGNVALDSGSDGGRGGGARIRGVANATLTGNTIISNVAAVSVTVSGGGNWGSSSGGGVNIGSNDSYTPTVVISDNLIAQNTAGVTIAVSASGGGSGDGGGVRLDRVAAATIVNNQISQNMGLGYGTADGVGSRVFANGGGLNFGEVTSITLRANQIEGNEGAGGITLSGGATEGGAGGGGLSFYQSTILLQSNVISGNTSNLNGGGWGGGVDASESVVTMEANFILGNRMNPTYSGGSGGVWIWESTLTSTNDVFARNFDAIGAGDNGTPSTLTLINNTLYDNGGVGVWVGDSSTGYVTNTIVYSHDNGLDKNVSATFIEDYNLLSNTTNYAGGVLAGSHTITNTDPLLKDAAGDDFHLTSASPAIDQGTSLGAPDVDFEDDPRPQGQGVDMGADELRGKRLYLPIIFKNASP